MAEPSDLQKMREWISTFNKFPILDSFKFDYTDRVSAPGAIFPAGLQEISRKENITGSKITVENQYNFGIYCNLDKAPGDDEGAQINADWVMDFQRWVQAQSVKGKAPTFGNFDQSKEQIKAQNGALYAAEDEGTAVYMVQLSVRFKLVFKLD